MKIARITDVRPGILNGMKSIRVTYQFGLSEFSVGNASDGKEYFLVLPFYVEHDKLLSALKGFTDLVEGAV